MKGKLKIWAVAALLAVQIAAIGWIIVRYEQVVIKGVECRFACSAYDPYDPLRGRYLRMRVEDTCPTADDFSEEWNFGAYIQIDPHGGTNGLAKVVACAKNPGTEGLWVYREGLRNGWDRKQTVRVVFPDQFFMNEHLAPKAEKILSGKMASAVAVYRIAPQGIVLTDVEIDGVSISELAKRELADASSD